MINYNIILLLLMISSIAIYVMDRNSNDFSEVIINGDNLTIDSYTEVNGSATDMYTSNFTMEKIIYFVNGQIQIRGLHVRSDA